MLKKTEKLFLQYLLPIFKGHFGKKPTAPPRQPRIDPKRLKATVLDLAQFKLPEDRNALISVIMPTYNRGELISKAIASVLNQTYKNFELIIVDDGSEDDTRSVIEAMGDSRIVYLRQENQGVSAARNTGLNAATGDYVAYIDSDNEWRSNYLEFSLKYCIKNDASCLYSILTIVDGKGSVKSYRAADFDAASLWDRNFIDLNVFFHSLQASNRINFDTRLRRAVDWDYIVRVIHNFGCKFAYFDQCIYSDAADESRLTISAYSLYTKIVRAKNHFYSDDQIELLRLARLAIGIIISAPSKERASWGDYYYARSLQKYLLTLGYAADIVYSDTTDAQRKKFDINIVLRGRHRAKHAKHQLNILWIISHPETVTAEECADYDHIFSASGYFEALLRLEGVRKTSALLQGSDPSLFRRTTDVERSGIIFVGRTKNVDRRFIVDIVQNVDDARVIGDGWEKYIKADKILARWVQYPQLPSVYRNAGTVLAEHWRSMRLFGIVANRVSDAIGCGARVLSDKVRGDGYLRGSSYLSCEDSAEAVRILGNWQGEAFAPHSIGFVSMEDQAAEIDKTIASLVFRYKDAPIAPKRQHQLIIARGRDWTTSEWLLMNRIMPQIPAEKLIQLEIRHETADDQTCFRFDGELIDLSTLPSLLGSTLTGELTQSRLLDERLWRLFSVGKYKSSNPAIGTIIANSVEEALEEFDHLVAKLIQVRVWDPHLTRRVVLKNGKIHKQSSFEESARSRIRRFLLDAESTVTAVGSKVDNQEFYYHVALATGSYVATSHPAGKSSIETDETWRAFFIHPTDSTIPTAVEADKIRDRYWARFADQAMI
jgi:glycosyltransferase involved in cell wall biosynthesis